MTAITILLPTSGTPLDALLIERTLAMIRAQTFQDWHLIVIESGPQETHNLYEITHRKWAAPWLTWLYRPQVQSLALALQFALAHVEATELLVFASHEYTWEPEYLTEMWGVWHKSRGQLGMVYCNEAEFDGSGLRVHWIPRVRYDRNLLFRFCWMHLPAMGLSYTRVMDLEGFQFLDEQTPDWDMALRLSRFGIKHIARALVRHHWTTFVYPDPLAQEHARPQIDFRMRLGLYGDEALDEMHNWRTYPQLPGQVPTPLAETEETANIPPPESTEQIQT